ncbi:hypothetical protein JM47_01065 [Ureaplasma diversum]|uniref:Extracellular matrix-binding protein ebh GA module domain-containing protein n=1 Tax=Ureaplasma diversum TaxID=42094 RepID=A0A0C5RBE8_9BACT|nr:GA module-containing protein [Ureaplasma diversum]AJQ45221.1 hypothetical protein JM47_01065 [Ureaplasma diversum]
MNKLNSKSKKGILIGVGGFIVASTITGVVAGVAVNKQANDRRVESELLAKKTETVNKINGLSSLKPEEVNKFNKEVNEARSIQEVDDVLAKANQTSSTNKANQQAQLIKSKNDAKDQVSGLVSLNNQQKELLLKEIDDADTEQKVQVALVKANQAQLTSKKTEVKNQINDLVDLTPEQKTALLKEVEATDSTQKVEAVLEKAKTLVQTNKTNKRLLLQQQANSKKIEANNQIDQLADLSEDDKNKFKEQIAKSSSQEDINKIIENANQLNNQNKANKEKELTEKKQEANTSLESLVNLSTDQKDQYKNRIDNAKTKDDIERILASGRSADQKAKEEAEAAYTTSKATATLYITGSMNEPKYVDGRTELQSKIKVYEEVLKDATNQNTSKYLEAKTELDNAIIKAMKHVEMVNNASKPENKLTLKTLQYQYWTNNKDSEIKNLQILIEGKNINARFNNDPKSILLIKNSKQNINYFQAAFPKYLKNRVFQNDDTKIDFGADLIGRKSTSGDVEIDKLVLISDKEYHIINLDGKTLKFNGSTTKQTVNAS